MDDKNLNGHVNCNFGTILMDELVKLKVYKEKEEAILPTVAYGNSACFDFYAIHDVEIPSGENRYIENGLRIIIPENYYLQFHSRSSLGFLKDLYVYNGILDANFCGNLKIKLYNFGKKDYLIKKGDKYAQATLHRMVKLKFDEISKKEFLKAEETARNYWGSSGK